MTMTVPASSPSAPSPLKLARDQALILCVDVQDRLAQAMPEELLERLSYNACNLLRGAQALGVPVLVSEQ